MKVHSDLNKNLFLDGDKKSYLHKRWEENEAFNQQLSVSKIKAQTF